MTGNVFEKKPQNAKFEFFSNGQISAGNRNFCPIFGFRPEKYIFLRPKKNSDKTPEISALRLLPKSKLLKKIPKMPNLNFFQMTKFRPEIEISRRFFDFRPENTYCFGRKKFRTKRPNFRPSGYFQSQNFWKKAPKCQNYKFFKWPNFGRK